MNQKQKLGYMALGAGILAVGIIIGQFVTPDIEAQSNGVFDKITCRSLEVLDQNDNRRIHLYALGPMAEISIMSHWNNKERDAISLTSFVGFNPDGSFGNDNSNSITISKPSGTSGIELNTQAIVNYVKVRNKAGNTAILLGGAEDDSGITLYDKYEKLAVRLDTTRTENGVTVFGRAGQKEMIKLFSADTPVTAMFVSDSGGNIKWAAPMPER